MFWKNLLILLEDEVIEIHSHFTWLGFLYFGGIFLTISSSPTPLSRANLSLYLFSPPLFLFESSFYHLHLLFFKVLDKIPDKAKLVKDMLVKPLCYIYR